MKALRCCAWYTIDGQIARALARWVQGWQVRGQCKVRRVGGQTKGRGQSRREGWVSAQRLRSRQGRYSKLACVGGTGKQGGRSTAKIRPDKQLGGRTSSPINHRVARLGAQLMQKRSERLAGAKACVRGGVQGVPGGIRGRLEAWRRKQSSNGKIRFRSGRQKKGSETSNKRSGGWQPAAPQWGARQAGLLASLQLVNVEGKARGCEELLMIPIQAKASGSQWLDCARGGGGSAKPVCRGPRQGRVNNNG